MKTLVVYYSRTGSTKNAAEHIAKQLGADLDELIDSKNRMGLWGWLMAGRDALRKYTTTLMDIKKNPADYDLVIIGTPIWAGTITPAIRTYVIKYAGKLKKVAFFICNGSTPVKAAFPELEKLCGKKPAATLALKGAELATGESFYKITRFTEQLK